MDATALPSVDEVVRGEAGQVAIARFGRAAMVDAVRAALGDLREKARHGDASALPSRAAVSQMVAKTAIAALVAADAPRLRSVFNLTGTVLHTNLGRAVLAEEAIEAAVRAMRSAAALEYDLATGERGERDDIVRSLICELTGAEDAIAVNNNAAALVLVLNTLASGRQTIVSRGELIEIGGAFRLPEMMARAGTELVEIGTTNRTHLADYDNAIGERTGTILKVHTSNYLIQGFTKEVSTAELAPHARSLGVPLVDDLGSGTLIDLAAYGLRRERSVQDAVRDGADLVTFSGDKLLGGPQAGFVVGRREFVRACAKNPLKRAVRLDKIRLAALEATLRLYRDPDRLAERLPTLRALTRALSEIAAQAARLASLLQSAVGAAFQVTIVDCASQIGSGALPLETVASAGLAVTPVKRGQDGRRLIGLAAAFRALPTPVIGRIERGAFVLDLRCLDAETTFTEQLGALALEAGSGEPAP